MTRFLRECCRPPVENRWNPAGDPESPPSKFRRTSLEELVSTAQKKVSSVFHRGAAASSEEAPAAAEKDRDKENEKE